MIFKTDTQVRREAIAAALTWRIAAPELRRRALHGSRDYADYRRRVNQIDAVVFARRPDTRIMGARI